MKYSFSSVRCLRDFIKEELKQQAIIEPKGTSPYEDTFEKSKFAQSIKLAQKNGWDKEFVQELDVAFNEALWNAMTKLAFQIKNVMPDIGKADLAEVVEDIANTQLEHFVGYMSMPPAAEEVVKAIETSSQKKN